VSAIAIRPRRATELVDAGFQLLRRFYPQLLTVTAIAMAPSVFARIAMRDALANPALMMARMGPVMGGVLIIIVCSIFADGVLVVATSNGYLDSTVDLTRAFRDGTRRLLPVIATNILRYLAFMGAAMVVALLGAVLAAGRVGWLLIFLVPFAFWYAFRIYLGTFAATAAVLLEGLGPVAALKRSWQLSDGCRTHVFWTLLLSWILYFVLYVIATTVGMTMFTPTITVIIAAVAIVLVYPFLAVVSTLLYYDLRVRKEGFDLEVMSRELGAAGTTTPLPAL
jgi:hypothetical protein